MGAGASTEHCGQDIMNNLALDASAEEMLLQVKKVGASVRVMVMVRVRGLGFKVRVRVRMLGLGLGLL